MLESWTKEWREMKESRPGQRFQDRYHRSRQSSHGVLRVVRPILGLLVALAGVLLMPAPGPGWLVFIVGMGLMASDFLVVARFLDGAEVRVRALATALRRWWSRSSAPIRVTASAVVGLVILAGAWGMWRIVFGR